MRAFCIAVTRWAACVVLLLIALANSGSSEAGEIARRSFASDVLGREFAYKVYLPAGYEASRSRQYPVLYLLHGAGGTENSWVDLGHIKETADRLIAEQAIPPIVIVLPGCAGGWWVDSDQGKLETVFWNELEPNVAANFRTIEGRKGRMVAGLSAGGYSAVRFALQYPERFGAAAALSPAIYSDVPPQVSSARRHPRFLDARGEFSATAWKTLNYPSLLKAYFAKRRAVPFFLSSGDKDALGIAFETSLLFKQLVEHQPNDVELRDTAGDHSWEVWSRAVVDAMKFMTRAVAKNPSLSAHARVANAH